MRGMTGEDVYSWVLFSKQPAGWEEKWCGKYQCGRTALPQARSGGVDTGGRRPFDAIELTAAAAALCAAVPSSAAAGNQRNNVRAKKRGGDGLLFLWIGKRS